MSMFLNRILEPPRYGWQTTPTRWQVFREALHRMNLVRSRKHWLAFSNWFWTAGLGVFAALFFLQHFSLAGAIGGFLYGMVWMGSHGTLWLHRYGTHRAFEMPSRFWRMVLRHLSIKVVPEEIYIVSHHVHHAMPDESGDPYYAERGGLYCFLADTNHQPIARDLSAEDYDRVVGLLAHTGIVPNSYAQYLRWGSVAHPLRLSLLFAANWLGWYAALFLLGGHDLAVAIFAGAFFWAVGIRTFNHAGHGGGRDRRKDGVDFNRRDRSVNQWWPGFVAGEWHNNHHLFPRSARAGLLWYQLDLPFLFVRLLHRIGIVSSFRDGKPQFEAQYRDSRRTRGPSSPTGRNA
jgi:fatty-acid desaturase